MCNNFTDFLTYKFYDISTQQRQLVLPCNFSEQNFENFAIRGLLEKTQKILLKILDLAISGYHTSAMITDCQKFASKWSLYGISSFHFHSQNQFKVFPWAVHFTEESYSQIFRHCPMSDVQYCVPKPIVRCSAGVA